MTFRALASTAAVLAVLAAAAGCSSAGPAPGRSAGSTAAAASSSAPATSAVATAPSTVSTPSATATAATSAAGSTPAPSSSSAAPGAPRSTCGSLTVRVIRGSAAPGYEFAALQFVNTGSVRCVLNGYPTVTLLRSGAAVGRPSAPESTATSRFTLQPGATAESRLKDFSSCQAPLSDSIRVVAPGSSITATRPGQLRACTLQVSALTTPE